MAEINWEVIKVFHCDYVGHEVSLDGQFVYPADYLPDMPRMIAHRCSDAESCNMIDKPSCVWSGINPNFYPR
jgi:hypothetical protein